MTRFSSILVSIALLTSGCGMVLPDDPNQNDPVIPDPDPDPKPEPAQVDGTYQVVTTFDLTVDAVLPETAYNAVGVLRDFRADPAATLFALLEDAGVPLVSELLAVMPASLEGKLMDWINDYIASAVFENTPVLDVIDQVLALAETSLTQFEMMSEMDLLADPDMADQWLIEHRIRGLRFPALGLEQAIDVPSLGPLTDTQASAWIDHAPADPAVDGDAQLTLGEHQFGLPYGEYAYSALEMVVMDSFGADLRGTVGAAVNCPALAADVAGKCVLNLCVGHEQELNDICEQGLDLAVAKLQEKFAEYRFDAIDMQSGEAAMWDTQDSAQAADGRIDHLSGGLWQSSVDLGMGLRELPATFEGVRVQP